MAEVERNLQNIIQRYFSAKNLNKVKNALLGELSISLVKHIIIVNSCVSVNVLGSCLNGIK